MLQPNESLYDQKPEEVPVQVPSSDSTSSTPKSFASRFEYTDNVQPAEISSGGARVLSHVSPPKSSNFFADYGMDSGFSKKTSSTLPKVQVSFGKIYPIIVSCGVSDFVVSNLLWIMTKIHVSDGLKEIFFFWGKHVFGITEKVVQKVKMIG